MKLEYEKSKRELRKMLNLALGIHLSKIELSHFSFTQPKSIFSISIKAYLASIGFFWCAMLISYLNMSNLEIWYILISFLLFFIATFFLLLGLIHNLKIRNEVRGYIEINEDGIWDYKESGKIIKVAYPQIKYLYKDDNHLFIYCKKIIFLLDYNQNLEEKIKTYLPSIKIITKENKRSLLKKVFINYVSFLLIILVLIGNCVFLVYQNTTLLDQEMHTLISTEKVNPNLKTIGKFQLVEKELKQLYQEYYNLEENYYKNSALGLFNRLTKDYLKNNKKDLISFKNNLYHYMSISEKQLEKIYDFFNKEKEMERIKKYELEDYFVDLYEDYNLANDSSYQIYWASEMTTNQQKMGYLDSLLTVLTKGDNCWEITEEGLYFCDDQDTAIYNHYYDLMIEETKIGDNKVSM